MKNNTFRPLTHIPYDQGVLPYHEKVAGIIHGLAGHGSSVLDVGCGNGAGTLKIGYRADLKITALDGDPECVKAAQELLGDTVAVEQGNASDLPNTKFDFVTSSHVAEHLENPLDFVVDLWGMVENGGYLVLCVPNIITPVRVVNALFRRDRTNEGHLYGWDYGHLELFLKRSGLPEAVIHPDAVPLVPGRYRERFAVAELFGRVVSRVLPRLAESFVAVVKKID